MTAVDVFVPEKIWPERVKVSRFDRNEYYLRKAFDEASRDLQRIATVMNSNGLEELVIGVGPGLKSKVSAENVYRAFDNRERVVVSKFQLDQSPSFRQFCFFLKSVGATVDHVNVLTRARDDRYQGTEISFTLGMRHP